MLRFALLCGGQNLAFVYPDLHADYAVCRAGFGETVIDVSAQRVQRQTALQIPFGAGDFVSVQASAYANFDSFASETQRRVYRFAHGAAEAYALFKLQRDGFRNQLRIEFGLVHFLDVDINFAAGALLHVLLQLVDFRALCGR